MTTHAIALPLIMKRLGPKGWIGRVFQWCPHGCRIFQGDRTPSYMSGRIHSDTRGSFPIRVPDNYEYSKLSHYATGFVTHAHRSVTSNNNAAPWLKLPAADA